MRQKLNLITLGVDNFEKAIDFYERGLGWKKVFGKSGRHCIFPAGWNCLIALSKKARWTT